MDLSADDLISKYYSPYEIEIKKIFSALPDGDQRLLSFIDVIDKKILLDTKKKVITDQLLDSSLYQHLNICQLPDSIFGIYYIPEELQDAQIDLDFNLFMNRANQNRLFWFYKAIEMDYINSAAISYIGSTNRSERPDLNEKELVDFFHQRYFYPHFSHAHQFAINHVPYQNFVDSGDLRKIMIKTKLSVVMESYHERIDAIALSEKIFRALQVPRPWVLSGATGSVARLRSLGFDVFDQYVDHSYDQYDTSQNTCERDSAILSEIERFQRLKITNSMLKDWHAKYQKNMSLLLSWHNNWRQDLKDFVTKHFL